MLQRGTKVLLRLDPIGSLLGEVNDVSVLQTGNVIVSLLRNVLRSCAFNLHNMQEEIIPAANQCIATVGSSAVFHGFLVIGEHLVGSDGLALEFGIGAAHLDAAVRCVCRIGGGSAEAGDAEHRRCGDNARRKLLGQ